MSKKDFSLHLKYLLILFSLIKFNFGQLEKDSFGNENQCEIWLNCESEFNNEIKIFGNPSMLLKAKENLKIYQKGHPTYPYKLSENKTINIIGSGLKKMIISWRGQITTMERLFEGITTLKKVDLSKADLSQVKNINSTFSGVRNMAIVGLNFNETNLNESNSVFENAIIPLLNLNNFPYLYGDNIFKDLSVTCNLITNFTEESLWNDFNFTDIVPIEEEKYNNGRYYNPITEECKTPEEVDPTLNNLSFSNDTYIFTYNNYSKWNNTCPLIIDEDQCKAAYKTCEWKGEYCYQKYLSKYKKYCILREVKRSLMIRDEGCKEGYKDKPDYKEEDE
ncbi:MAG: hypothetical protein MJ252_23725 [archaeon]|nr:hypothetical protein [archaeon]